MSGDMRAQAGGTARDWSAADARALDLIRPGRASAEGTARGGCALAEASGGTPEVILIATGSAEQIALAARAPFAASQVTARVVSMSGLEWFAEQDDAYREQVLPASVRARVSTEARRAPGWREYGGGAG